MSNIVEWFLGRNCGACIPESAVSVEDEYYRPGVILSSYYEAIEQALSDYPWLTSQDDIEGNTALHIVAQYDHDDVALILINRGAPISAENIYGHKPIDVAYYYMSTRTLALLYEYAIVLIQRRWRQILAIRNRERNFASGVYFLENQVQNLAIN